MRRTGSQAPSRRARQYAQRDVERHAVLLQEAGGAGGAMVPAGVQHGLDEHGGDAVMASIHRSLPEG
ncbi:hypothetical protein ASD28_08335 [Massilia sp. Root133]|nr:hypothetical protein ASD28_08335 [Massilia sp. Root133]